jgi:SAM-dependent methyltransferase
MFQSVTVSLLALLLASGIALAQPAAQVPAQVPSQTPATGAPKADAPPAAAPMGDPAKTEPAKKPEYEPQVGQPGKDVVWVPTPQSTVDRMLDMAAAKPGDYVIDLGSGNGITVITAAKRGIRALGVEYNPDMVELSRRNAEKEKEAVGDRATFVQGDIFKTDFSKADVLTLYLLPRLNMQLRPTILKMKPGTRVASHSFDMEDWKPDQAVNSAGEKCEEFCSAYFWMVPANVNGSWRIAQGRLRLNQKFQHFTGTLRMRGKSLKIADGRVRGEAIAFTAGGVKYTGTVKGRKMSVTAEKG